LTLQLVWSRAGGTVAHERALRAIIERSLAHVAVCALLVLNCTCVDAFGSVACHEHSV
jgi:hypothetical protein